MVKVDDELEVKILKVDSEARKIGLSLRRAQWAAEEHGGAATEAGTGEPAPQTAEDKPAEEAKVEATEPGSPAGEQPTAVSEPAQEGQGDV